MVNKCVTFTNRGVVGDEAGPGQTWTMVATTAARSISSRTFLALRDASGQDAAIRSALRRIGTTTQKENSSNSLSFYGGIAKAGR
jgi:hypothetical protein